MSVAGIVMRGSSQLECLGPLVATGNRSEATWYDHWATDVQNDRVMSAQEARELTMIERARHETGRTMSAAEAIEWYEGWRAEREAADAE